MSAEIEQTKSDRAGPSSETENARPASGNKERELELLEIIERSPDVTQRGIAKEMRIALGLANSVLKRLARKGWIKIGEVPGRRLLYYLTPKGMSEKTRLTYEYIRYSVQFYGEARTRCGAVFSKLCREKPNRRVAFLGRSDLAEIAYLSLLEYPLEFVALFDSQSAGSHFFGKEIRPVEAIGACRNEFDILVYTRIEPPSADPALNGIEFVEIFE